MDECTKQRVFIITNETIYSHLFRNAILFLNKRGYNVLNSKGDNEQLAVISDYFLPIKPYNADVLISALKANPNAKLLSRKLC